jgi:hypothetical protein
MNAFCQIRITDPGQMETVGKRAKPQLQPRKSLRRAGLLCGGRMSAQAVMSPVLQAHNGVSNANASIWKSTNGSQRLWRTVYVCGIRRRPMAGIGCRCGWMLMVSPVRGTWLGMRGIIHVMVRHAMLLHMCWWAHWDRSASKRGRRIST